MNPGRSITDLAKLIMDQRTRKADYIASCSTMTMREDGVLTLQAPGTNPEVYEFACTELCHEQIAGKLKIPLDYYRRMREEAPMLMAENVNTWFDKQRAKRYMVRTLDDKARAFLGEGYRRLDYFDLCQATLPVLAAKHAEVKSCEVTERRLYLKAFTMEVQGEVRVGELVCAGVQIRDSEVGMSQVEVDPMLLKLTCSNGAKINVGNLRKRHVGKRLGSLTDDIEELLSDEAKRADDQAFWLAVRDVVTAVLTEVTFQTLLEKCQWAAKRPVVSSIPDVLERVEERYHLQEGESAGILTFLTQGGDLTQWGLSQAVTRLASDITSYDRASELEEIGGEIITLSMEEWTALN